VGAAVIAGVDALAARNVLDRVEQRVGRGLGVITLGAVRVAAVCRRLAFTKLAQRADGNY
jgi:hypothetical protein